MAAFGKWIESFGGTAHVPYRSEHWLLGFSSHGGPGFAGPYPGNGPRVPVVAVHHKDFRGESWTRFWDAIASLLEQGTFQPDPLELETRAALNRWARLMRANALLPGIQF